VECIGKGKTHKKFEFGTKVGLVMTAKTNWIVGAEAYPGNPYDGHTLKSALSQTAKILGHEPTARQSRRRIECDLCGIWL